MKKNLISVGQLDDSGHSINFRDDEWKVTKRAMVIAREKKRSTLYMITESDNVVVVAAGNDDASLWHNKLGHMSQMNELLSKGKPLELKNVHFDMCESCIMGKQKKLSFLTGDKKLRATKLDLVHTNL